MIYSSQCAVANLLLACFVVATSASAQESFVYSLNTDGRVTVNGATLKNLKGGLDYAKFLDFEDLDDIEEAWLALAVVGPDWWALRYDGRLSRNGDLIDELGFNDLDDAWIDLLIDDGDAVALRSDGRVNVNGSLLVALPDGDFYFREILSDGDDRWTLRSDGRVFRNAITPGLFRFNGPDGVFGGDDGEDSDTVWSRFAVDPTNGDIVAIRRDGRVGRATPADFDGSKPGGTPPSAGFDTSLPFPNDKEDVGIEDLYTAVLVLADGRWVVLRRDGRVYREGDGIVPIANLPGDPDSLDDSLYVDILAVEGALLALREDGRVYSVELETLLINLPKRGYRELAWSSEFPNLAGAKTKRPASAKVTVDVLVGGDVSAPVLITDVDTNNADLTVVVDATTLPTGASFDDGARRIVWPAAGPAGKYTVKHQATDLEGNVRKGSTKIIVREVDASEKNKPPRKPKLKKLVALDGLEIEFPIPLFDPDGDELTLTFDETKPPFSQGADISLVDGEYVFTWTPALTDQGKVKVKIAVSDGELTKTFTIPVKVTATLLTFP